MASTSSSARDADHAGGVQGDNVDGSQGIPLDDAGWGLDITLASTFPPSPAKQLLDPLKINMSSPLGYHADLLAEQAAFPDDEFAAPFDMLRPIDDVPKSEQLDSSVDARTFAMHALSPIKADFEPPICVVSVVDMDTDQRNRKRKAQQELDRRRRKRVADLLTDLRDEIEKAKGDVQLRGTDVAAHLPSIRSFGGKAEKSSLLEAAVDIIRHLRTRVVSDASVTSLVPAGAHATVSAASPLDLSLNMFHGASCMMVCRSIESQRILDVNIEFERQSGFRRQEVVGQPFHALFRAFRRREPTEAELSFYSKRFAALLRGTSPAIMDVHDAYDYFGRVHRVTVWIHIVRDVTTQKPLYVLSASQYAN